MVDRISLVEKFAAKYSIDPSKLLEILKATAFKVKEGVVSNEQMASLLVVADAYELNPFTKEIYAFPDKQGGIVPVVSVDGWARIVNSNPQMDGFEFRYSPETIEPGDVRFPGLKYFAHEWIECVMYRKDRSKPSVIREYFEEVYRPPFKGFSQKTSKEYTVDGPWQSHDKRMHRHKTFIQGGRFTFGFAGIYDEDEAARILEAQENANVVVTVPAGQSRANQAKDALKAKLAAPTDNPLNEVLKPVITALQPDVIARQAAETTWEAQTQSGPTKVDWIAVMKTAKPIDQLDDLWQNYLAECDDAKVDAGVPETAAYRNRRKELGEGT